MESGGQRKDVDCYTTIRKAATAAHSEPPKTYQLLLVFLGVFRDFMLLLPTVRYACVYISCTEYCTRLPFRRSKGHPAIYGRVYMGTLVLETQMPGVYRCVPGPEGKVAIKCLDLVC